MGVARRDARGGLVGALVAVGALGLVAWRLRVFVLRTESPASPGADVYLADTLGGVAGEMRFVSPTKASSFLPCATSPSTIRDGE